MIEKALDAAAPADVPELRYLLFRTYVVDLAPENGNLYKKLTAGTDEKREEMEVYQAYLDRLEAKVVAEGAAALPVLVGNLQEGDRLDLLLTLGLLEEMVAGDVTLPWHDPVDPHGVSPVVAARSGVSSAAADCVEQEKTLGVGPGYAVDDQRLREPYLQAVYTAITGLEFLAVADPPGWGAEAAEALQCRGAAADIVADRERIRRFRRHLRGPLREWLERALEAGIKIEILEILARIGECEDLDAMRSQEDPGDPEVKEAATRAEVRIRKRHGCDG